MPGGRVGAFLDLDRGRTVDEDKDLLSLAQMFLDTLYRRLPVLRDEKLMGQVSRRGLLQSIHKLTEVSPDRRGNSLLYFSSLGCDDTSVS